jgi:hypothetical protein
LDVRNGLERTKEQVSQAENLRVSFHLFNWNFHSFKLLFFADEEQNGLPPTSNLEIMDVFLVDHALDVQEAWNVHSSTFYGPPVDEMDLVSSDDIDMPEAPPVVATGQAPLEGMGYAG